MKNVQGYYLDLYSCQLTPNTYGITLSLTLGRLFVGIVSEEDYKKMHALKITSLSRHAKNISDLFLKKSTISSNIRALGKT